MVLNETGLSTWNWKQNSMKTADREKKEVIYNPEFYVMKHFSHSVLPGARRIKAEGDYDGSLIAFRNQDGSIVLLAGNFGADSKAINLKLQENSLYVTLEGRSIYSFVIDSGL
jgi:glucosylceramidase